MKDTIILILPDAKGEGFMPPYAFLYLERAIRDLSLNVIIIDERFDDDWKEILISNAQRLMLVGLSVAIGNQLISAIKISDFIKNQLNVPVIWGGWLPTWKPELCLSHPLIDFVAVGQGELIFSKLVTTLIKQNLNNASESFSEIPGLGYKVNDKMFINHSHKHLNYSDFPPVNLSLINIKQYTLYSKNKKSKSFHYFASYGCPYRCNFCFPEMEWRGKWFHNEIKIIINELRHIVNEANGINYIIFDDINFFGNRAFVMNLCRELIKNEFHFQWNASGHIKNILYDYSYEDLEIIKQAGCESVFVGAESGDQRVLDKLNKDLTVDEIIAFVKKMHHAQIKNSCSFMVFFPENACTDFKLTIKLVMRLMTISPYFHYAIHYYFPARTNYYYKKASEFGFSIPDNLEDLSVFFKKDINYRWHKDYYLKLFKYYGMYYLRFYKLNDTNIKTKYKFLNSLIYKISWPFIRVRFFFNYFGFPLGGWLYCDVLFKNMVDKYFFTDPNDRFFIGRIKNS
ncbi:MAG TPA: radical SAM protein [Bacteroidales bacterium]|nr:radical SAM protein [Bacteroidales bacterium]